MRGNKKPSHLTVVVQTWLHWEGGDLKFTKQGHLQPLPAKFHLVDNIELHQIPLISKNRNSPEISLAFLCSLTAKKTPFSVYLSKTHEYPHLT